MANGFTPTPVTVPANAVTLHLWEWSEAAEEARQRGEFGPPLAGPVTGQGVLRLPYEGPRVYAYCVAWQDEDPMYREGPMWVNPGDVVRMRVPVEGTLHSV
jgi:hypothetical protein